MEEQGEGPQEMAFVRATARSFLAKMRDSAGTGQAIPPEASLGETGPTLEISCQVHGVPGTLSVELHAFCPMQSRRVFLETALASRTLAPAKAECPGKNWGPGAGTGGLDRVADTVPCQVEWVQVGGTTQTDRFSCGEAV